MQTIVVGFIAAALIGLIIWWFFAPRKTTTTNAAIRDDHQYATITIDGGYSPEVITLRQGMPATLTIVRKNPSGCFDEIVFPDFGIREQVPLKKNLSIEISTDTAGEFQYSCGMHMFFGKVIIK